MTTSEVVKIMGSPNSKAGDKYVEVFQYYLNSNSSSFYPELYLLRFEYGKLVKFGPSYAFPADPVVQDINIKEKSLVGLIDVQK